MFSTKLDMDALYCVTKNQPHIAYQFLYLFIFFLSNGNFCHIFLNSYRSQCFQILCTPSDSQSDFVDENYDAYPHFAFFFILSFFPSATLIKYI